MPDHDKENNLIHQHEDSFREEDNHQSPIFDEEFAEPLTPRLDENYTDEPSNNEVFFHATSFVGWLSLIISFIALFTMPILFGSGGIILGFIARSRDAEWLGNIAIVLGIIAIISAFFIRPFM